MRHTTLLLAATALLSLACAGSDGPAAAPEPEAPAPTAPPASPEATVSGFDRSKHNGLPEGVNSWEIYRLVAEQRSPAHAVVLWGSKDEEAAWTWLEKYIQNGGPTRPGYPYVVASENIDGMNPGFFVVIAAQPSDQAVAEELVDIFKRLSVGGESLDGAYIKPVQIPLPETHLSADDMRPG